MSINGEENINLNPNLYFDVTHERNVLIISVVEKIKGLPFATSLTNCLNKEIAESNYFREFELEIVRHKSGAYHRKPHGIILGVWFDQIALGTEGDSWGVFIYIRIDKKRFIKAYFEI